MVVNAFLQLGWEPKIGDKVDLDDFVAKHGILEDHYRLTRAHLDTLADEGHLKKLDNNSWKVLEQLEERHPDAVFDELCEEFPGFASEAELQKITGPVLADVLTGEVDPVELLFPGGKSIDALTRFYREGG